MKRILYILSAVFGIAAFAFADVTVNQPATPQVRNIGGVSVIGSPTASGQACITATNIATCVWQASSGYTLPTATSSVLGGVKPDGTTIANSSGAISVAYAPLFTTNATVDNAVYYLCLIESAGAPGNQACQYVSTANINPSTGIATFSGVVANGQTVGYLDVVQNSQAAGYTLALTDRGKEIYMSSAGAFTIPANGSVAFPIGSTITFYNPGAASTIVITADTLIWTPTGGTGTRTLAQYGLCTIHKVTSTTWVISGSGLT